MNAQELIKEKLEKHTAFRERKDRGKYLATLSLRRYGLEQVGSTSTCLTKDELAKVCVTYETYERAWRKVLEENEHLRGSDYEEKTEKEEKVKKELGYQREHNFD